MIYKQSRKYSGETFQHMATPPSPETRYPTSDVTPSHHRFRLRSLSYESRSPSPCEPRKVRKVSIPELNINAEALLASLEGKLKTPCQANIGAISDRMPNGMVQVSHTSVYVGDGRLTINPMLIDSKHLCLLAILIVLLGNL